MKMAKELTGILLKDVLETISLDNDNPKHLSEYYFVCTACDGYKVVYSWNEIFNSSVGNSTFITEKDKSSIEHMDESVLMISTGDIRTGRRYLKNLEKISVQRAE